MWLAVLLTVLVPFTSTSATQDPCSLPMLQSSTPWLADNYGRLSFPLFNQGAVEAANAIIPSETCEVNTVTSNAVCNGQLNATFTSSLKMLELDSFVVVNFNVNDDIGNGNDTESNNLLDNWNIAATRVEKYANSIKWDTLFELMDGTYKVAGDLYSSAVGIGMGLSVNLYPNKYYDGFNISGTAFSNELRVGWQVEGELRILDNNEDVVIQAQLKTVGDGGWSFNGTCVLGDLIPEWQWSVNGTVRVGLLPAPITFAGHLNTTLLQPDSFKLMGKVTVKPLLIQWQIEASVTASQNEKITITQEILDGLHIKNLMFKDSYFLGDFDKNALQGVRALETISFINSKLEEMPRLDFLFKSLDTLKAISIEQSSMPNINMGSQSNLTNLQLLSLKGSGPIQLHDESASWLIGSNLTYLNLQDCNIDVVQKSQTFRKGILQPVAATLRYLDLSYTSVSEEALARILTGLALSHLSLAGLQLTRVPSNALQHINNTIRFLTLRENKFQKVPDENMFSLILSFPYMTNLEELDLTHCGINYIEAGVFDTLTGLKKLFLSRNNVENVQEGWYLTNPHLIQIDLSWNGAVIENAEFRLQSDVGLTNFMHLEIADFSNAVFSHSDAMVKSLSSATRILSLCNNDLQSSAVSDLQLLNLSVLDISGNPNVEYGSYEIAKMLLSLQMLEQLYARNNRITNNFFTTLSDLTGNNTALDFLVLLDLSGNSLKTISANMLKLFPLLSHLDVTSNSIAAWSAPLQLNSMRTLLISDNKIDTITNEMFYDLRKLESTELGRNPFLCGCSMLHFANQVTSTGMFCPSSNSSPRALKVFPGTFKMCRSKIKTKCEKTITRTSQTCVNLTDWGTSPNNYNCYVSDTEKTTGILELKNETNLCTVPENSPLESATQNLHPLYIGLGVLISFGLVGGLIYWKWWGIQMMTRAVRNAAILSFMDQDDVDEQKPHQYHAFVSYCEKDRGWVLQHMLPRLEEWSEISVCLHERDFEVGVSILDNITSSMDKSRHLVLVLSQSFIKSQWCQFELQLAQQRIIECKRDRLVLILLEPIPGYKRPKTLSFLMRTNTYMEWPGKKNAAQEQRFWDRLFAAIQ